MKAAAAAAPAPSSVPVFARVAPNDSSAAATAAKAAPKFAPPPAWGSQEYEPRCGGDRGDSDAAIIARFQKRIEAEPEAEPQDELQHEEWNPRAHSAISRDVWSDAYHPPAPNEILLDSHSHADPRAQHFDPRLATQRHYALNPHRATPNPHLPVALPQPPGRGWH